MISTLYTIPMGFPQVYWINIENRSSKRNYKRYAGEWQCHWYSYIVINYFFSFLVKNKSTWDKCIQIIMYCFIVIEYFQYQNIDWLHWLPLQVINYMHGIRLIVDSFVTVHLFDCIQQLVIKSTWNFRLNRKSQWIRKKEIG